MHAWSESRFQEPQARFSELIIFLAHNGVNSGVSPRLSIARAKRAGFAEGNPRRGAGAPRAEIGDFSARLARLVFSSVIASPKTKIVVVPNIKIFLKLVSRFQKNIDLNQNFPSKFYRNHIFSKKIKNFLKNFYCQKWSILPDFCQPVSACSRTPRDV